MTQTVIYVFVYLLATTGHKHYLFLFIYLLKIVKCALIEYVVNYFLNFLH